MHFFVLGKESVQIWNSGQSDARLIGMEATIGFWNSYTRPDKGIENENYSKNRLGKSVSFLHVRGVSTIVI